MEQLKKLAAEITEYQSKKKREKTIKLIGLEIKILELSLDMYINECEESPVDKHTCGKIQIAYDILDKLKS